MTDDEIITAIGEDALRELDAICAFCDCGREPYMALVPSNRRRLYEPGGDEHHLVEHGLVRLHRRVYLPTHERRMPALSMTHEGRRLLRRAAVRGINLIPVVNEKPGGE